MTAREWLDAVEARANAATDGPWAAIERAPSGVYIAELGMYGVAFDEPDEWHDSDEASLLDAEFIAHARTDVPALVAALRAVLDLADAADTPPPKGPLGASHAVRTRALRAAIDTHLGGAS